MSTAIQHQLDDVTFIIGLRIDSADRLRNVLAVTNWLRRTFTSQVIVGTDNSNSLRSLLAPEIEILDCDAASSLPFHSTRIYNALARQVRTPILIQLDADVVTPPAQLLEAAQMIRDGLADFVVPYEFVQRIPKIAGLDFLKSDLASDSGIGIREASQEPVGGCVVRDTSFFMSSGMENERLIGWGPDDKERVIRTRILGGRIKRVAGPLFHLEHVSNALSQTRHSYGINSWAEVERIQTQSREELKSDVSTWPWVMKETVVTPTPIETDDLTVTIPVRIDSVERLNNLIACTNALLATTTARIIVGIHDPGTIKGALDARVEIVPIRDPMSLPFHRTRILNELALLSTTTYLANVDADVVIPIDQWEATLQVLRQGSAGLVLPYDGRMVNVSWGHHPWLERATYASMPVINRRLLHSHSVGGCVVWRQADFFAVGMENENLVSWGFDDNDRVSRAATLGIAVHRVDGVLYHLDHPRGPDSSPDNSSYLDNASEYRRINSLNADALRAEISQWPWTQKNL
jgi:hypothetical protein